MPAPWEGLRRISAPARPGTRPGGRLVPRGGLLSCGPGTHKRDAARVWGSLPGGRKCCQVGCVSPAASLSAQSGPDPGRRGRYTWTPTDAWRYPQEAPTVLGPARAEEGTQTGTVVLRPWDSFPFSSHHHPVLLCPPPPRGAFSTFVPNCSPDRPCVCLYAVCLHFTPNDSYGLLTPRSRHRPPPTTHGLQESWARAFLAPPSCKQARDKAAAFRTQLAPWGALRKDSTRAQKRIPRNAWWPEVSSSSAALWGFVKHL